MKDRISSLEAIKRFLKFLQPYWRKGAFAFSFMLLSVILQIPMPFLTRYLIDNVIVQKNLQLLNIIGFVIIGVLLVHIISIFLERFLLTTFRGRVLFDIRLKLFEHIQKISLSFFHKNETGYLMSRVSGDVSAVQGLLADTLVAAGQNILTFLAGVACTIYIHPKLALISLLVLSFYVVSLAVFNKKIQRMSYENLKDGKVYFIKDEMIISVLEQIELLVERIKTREY